MSSEFETGPPERLYEVSRENVVSTYGYHGIDAMNCHDDHVLSFKMGREDDFANVALHLYPPYSDGNAVPIEDPAFVSIEFTHNLASIYATLMLGQCSPLDEGIAITSKHDTAYESPEEVAYIAQVIQQLARHAPCGILDFCGGDGCIYPVEYSFQPVVPELSVGGRQLVEFIDKRV